MNPTVSVIMGVFNCAATIQEAIDSIQNQTMTDWELIICDDGSTDETWKIADDYRKQNKRIVLIRNTKNLGLNETLNRCLSTAKGEFIARMDGDDICPSDRLESELLLLKNHSEYALVSGWMECFDEQGIYGTIHYREFPQYKDLVYGSQFCHAGCMMRREVLNALGGYNSTPNTERVEDYDLWVRLYAAGYKGYNLQRVVYCMRDDRNAYQRRKLRYRINESLISYRVYKACKLPFHMIRYPILPICKGLLPHKLYAMLHKQNVSRK